VLYSSGTKISLDISSPYTKAFNSPSVGRITLQPGKYHIKAALQEFSAGPGLGVRDLGLTLYNADSGTPLTFEILFFGSTRDLLQDETVVTITIPTRIEFRITDNNTTGPGGYSNAFIEVEELPA
jgi:hypothetical protein